MHTRRRLVGAAAAAVAGKFYFKAAEPKQRDLAAKRKNLASESKTLDLPAVRKSARRF